MPRISELPAVSKPTLYKATFHHKWTSAQDRAKHWTRMWFNASRWMNKHRKWSGYVNHYINVDDNAGTSEMVVVFTDRNTALMLKLALA